uniref:Uncharacterized protein n=1 Tax=Moniliophthora roreri TaxID=221103 RepID=A0A0W0EYR2_MONRR
MGFSRINSLFLTLLPLFQIGGSFTIDAPSSVKMKVAATASWKRVKGDPQQFKFFLRSGDAEEEMLTVVIQGDAEAENSFPFLCSKAGTYRIDVESNGSVFASRTAIQVQSVPSPAPGPAPPLRLAATFSSSNTGAPPASTVDGTSPATSPTSTFGVSSPLTTSTNNGQTGQQSPTQTPQNGITSSPSAGATATTNTSTVPTASPVAITIQSGSQTSLPTSLLYVLFIGAVTKISPWPGIPSNSVTASPPSPTAGQPASHESNNRTALIVGLVLGVLLLIVLLGFLWYWRRRRAQNRVAPSSMTIAPFARDAQGPGYVMSEKRRQVTRGHSQRSQSTSAPVPPCYRSPSPSTSTSGDPPPPLYTPTTEV